MKSLYTTMIAAVLSTCAITVYSQDVNAQGTNGIWVTVNNSNDVPVDKDGILISANSNVQNLIDTYSVTSFTQAFPSSRRESLLNVYQLNCSCEAEMLRQDAEKLEGFETAELIPDVAPFYTPDDYNLTFANDYALELINAEQAWEYSKGDTSVHIGITDTDYDLNHEELQGTVSAMDPVFYSSYYYHGTAVAITAAGNTDNTMGKSSIGSNCMLQLYNMNYNSILTATYNGAKVINASWGGCYPSSYAQQVIDEAYNNGSIVVASAGNGSTCNNANAFVYPASLNHVISVSSIGPSNNHERTIGNPATTHQHNDSVDLVAPGYDVPLTVASGWYLTGNGSSFAAPYVSGTIGLMLSVNPCLTFEQVEEILKATAFNVDTINPAYAGKLGAGRLDAGAALEMARNYSTYPINLQSSYDCSQYAFELSVSSLDPGQIFSTYQWGNADSTQTTYVNQNGFVSLKVTDQNGCVGIDSIPVNMHDSLKLNVQTTNQLCANGDDGEINIVPAGGFGSYSITVNGQLLDDSESNLEEGVYTIVVTDELNCVADTTVELISPEAIQVVADVQDEVDLQMNGSVELNVYGGVAPYVVDWNTGDTTFAISGLYAADYSAVITDANGCEFHDTYTVENVSEGDVDNITETPVVAGVDEEGQTEFTIYPNPSNGDVVTIDLGQNKLKELSVYDASGRLINQFNIFNGTTILLEDLSSGSYMIKTISVDDKTTTKKLLVTK